jgi:hypothetical protein
VIYFISGLGADKTAFQHLDLPEKTSIRHIDWIPPLKSETLPGYAARLTGSIQPSEPFFLVGLSFGGMLATEMSEIIKPVRTILISSAACRGELPFYIRWAGLFRLKNLVPGKLFTKTSALSYWFFGTRSRPEQLMLRMIMKNTDPKFAKWAIGAMMTWKRTAAPGGLVRIHGSKDRILPINGFHPDYLVKGGGHFMIVNRAGEISKKLQELGVY